MEQTGKAFLRSSRHAALLALCYFAAVMIPNCILFFTEPYSIWSRAALLTLPAGGYLLWSVAFRRSGIAVWLSFPVIFFCALQIVLLYLFGNSVAATDMFINIVTTNPGEATELLSNIYPSVILVCVIYLPLLWTATVHVRRKVDFSPRFRRRTAVVGGVLALVGAGLLIPAYQTKRHVLRNEIFPVNVAYNVVLCAREYVKIENYDRTSAGFRYHARRTAKADKREIYVYVIGEASRAANWELYGYDRPTNPRLKALGDEIVVFRNMLTQSNTTHKSVPMILSSVRTNEHDELFRRKGVNPLKMDKKRERGTLEIYTGAGTIFGVSGGVMEAALRTAYFVLSGEELKNADIEIVRGHNNAIVEATIPVPIKAKGGQTVDIRICVVNGANQGLEEVLHRVRLDKNRYHFIEVMNCPGGCVNGGGQPVQPVGTAWLNPTLPLPLRA